MPARVSCAELVHAPNVLQPSVAQGSARCGAPGISPGGPAFRGGSVGAHVQPQPFRDGDRLVDGDDGAPQ